MKKAILPLSLVLVVSVLVLGGCKGDEPATDANQPEPGQTRPDPYRTQPEPSQSSEQVESNPTAEQAAIKCAEAWLALADAEKNAESYDQAAALFRRAVTKERWLQSIDRLKKPLGKMVSRKILSKRYTTTAPGAPDGQYVIIQYQTRFENKTAAVETITPTLERDGKWRVSGYFIK